MRKADIPSDVRFRSVKDGESTCSRRLLRYNGIFTLHNKAFARLKVFTHL